MENNDQVEWILDIENEDDLLWVLCDLGMIPFLVA
jgi:hypothetical protein